MPMDLTKEIGVALQQLLERGFELPLHFACVAINGSILAGRYWPGEETLECELLAEHYHSAGFQCPINIMLIDNRGEAARLVIEKDGRPQLIQ